MDIKIRNRKKEKVNLRGLCREIHIFFLDSLSSCMHCKPVCFFYQVRNVVFGLCNESSCGITTDSLCSILFRNPYDCSNR
jgi:hypothetical protein